MERIKKSIKDSCFDTDFFICLSVLAAMAVYYYGLRAFVIIAVLAAVSVLCVALTAKLRKKPYDARSLLAAVFSGIMLALMFPASVPFYIAVICGIFSELIVIGTFGGHGKEIFSGAAAGYVLGEICFPEENFRCPPVFSGGMSLAIPNDLSAPFSRTMLTAGSSPHSDLEIILGRTFSPMGTGVILLLAVIALYLMLKGKLSFIVFLSQTAVYGIFSAVYGSGAAEAEYNLCSGMYLFVSVFAVCGKYPKRLGHRVIYGIFSGAFICLFRYYSLQENPAVYASLISAAFCTVLKQREKTIGEGGESIEKRTGTTA